MNWVLGFRELGWDVWTVEDVPAAEILPPDAPGLRSPQEEFWDELVRDFGLEGRATLLIEGASPNLDALRDFARDADLFVNYAGQFRRLDLLGARTKKAYLDVDPAFTQLWAQVHHTDMNFEGHDVFLTVGSNINGSSALLPKAGREWIPTFPPVAVEAWRKRLAAAGSVDPFGAWTTIGHWYGYPEMEWEGRKYGGKRDSFVAVRDLPRQIGPRCAIATDLQPDWHDYPEFAQAGWEFFPSIEVCASIPNYLQFIDASRGEIGVAKTGYVTSRGGWLSDRSGIYLALGRPVVQQDTGWTKTLPSTEGLVPFHDLDSCRQAIEAVESDYDAHSRAARALADGPLSAREVLSRLVEKL